MMVLIRLKMAVFAPMPSAKEITAMAVKPGLFCIKRNANRTSCEIMVASYAGPKRQSTILEAAHVEIMLQTIVWTTVIFDFVHFVMPALRAGITKWTKSAVFEKVTADRVSSGKTLLPEKISICEH